MKTIHSCLYVPLPDSASRWCSPIMNLLVAIIYFDWIILFVESWLFQEWLFWPLCAGWIRKSNMWACIFNLRVPRSCWLITLIVDFQIYSSRWNLVKVAFLFTRYYPLVVAPFQFWGFILDHDESVCESHYRALFASIIPTVRPLALSLYSLLTISLKILSGQCKHN